MPRHILAIDLGTSALKVALVSGGGDVVASEQEMCRVELRPGGGAEQDPEDWWALIARASSRLLGGAAVAPGSVAAVCCTAQWSGTVPVGADGRADPPRVIWMDSRGAPQARRITRGPVRVQGYGLDKLARWIGKTGRAFPRGAARTPSRTSCG